ncbi:MAG: YkgJ family cysteine cluster protein [Mailhella sp.]|nr:YkgJ family cysteine cluster protein [Mailhella sp.]
MQGKSISSAYAELFDESSPYFSCRRCGKCCEGRGGIVVSPRDLPRLCMFFGMPAKAFLERYTENMRNQPVIRCGSDGFCMFFKKGRGCSIHPARPAVCRAWPFFRGNLVDHVSLAMARQDCPGISRECSHAEFAEEGYRYLCEYKLRAEDPQTEGRMLIIKKSELPVGARGENVK